MVATKSIRRLGTNGAGRPQWLVASLVITPARTATTDCPARPATRRWQLTKIGGGGGSGTDYERLATRTHLGSSGFPDNNALAAVDGIVPDGVASVTITYPGDHGPPRTWPVKRNYFSYRVKLPVEQAYTGTVTWNAPDGTVIQQR